MTPEIFSTHRCVLGEGPIWDEQSKALWWVDIKSSRILNKSPESNKTHSWEQPVRPSALARSNNGDFVVAYEDGVYRWCSQTNERTLLAVLRDEPANNRSNDGKCDRYGRMWIGTMDDGETKDTGALHCCWADGRSERVLGGVGISNTLAWTAGSETFYFADSKQQLIWAFDCEPDKPKLHNRRVFVNLQGTNFYPDGSCIDSDGYLWNAQWDGWRVVRYAPDGTEDKVVHLPVQRPTSCIIGGENGKTLFITSASIGLEQELKTDQPHAGFVFAVPIEVPGQPQTLFGD